MIFDQLGGKLPAFTRGFMYVHSLLCHDGAVPDCRRGGLRRGESCSCRTSKGHEVLSRIVLRLPLFGKLFSEVFVAMFCSTIAMLLESGVPVLDAFEILRGMTNNDVIDRRPSRRPSSISPVGPISPLSMARGRVLSRTWWSR